MSAYLGVHKIMLMIHQSQICQSSNHIAYLFLNEVTCAILMKLQIQFFLLISFLCDTCCLLQCISTTSFSLSDSCDVFYVLVFEDHLMHNKINMCLWPCYQANILFLYYMNSFWVSFSFFSIYFVCTCFFEDKYFRDVVHLKTYTHER